MCGGSLRERLLSIILQLGSLHTEMSFLGTMTVGSSLLELLDLIYVSKAMDQMLTVKAIARAVRAYLLVVAALTTITASKAFHPSSVITNQMRGMIVKLNCQRWQSVMRKRHMLKKGLLPVMEQEVFFLKKLFPS